MTKNFRKQEFESRDGADMPIFAYDNLKIVVGNLQVLRDYLGVPIHINSGYRSPRHNQKIGGVRNSYHTKGMAVDISVKNLSPRKVRRAILRLIKVGAMKEGGIGLYNGFVHYDIRGTKARWNKTTLF